MQENTNSRLPEDMSTEAFDYYFKVYLDKVIGLVHTLQIKSHKQAEDLNETVLKKTANLRAVNPHDYRTWKYYKNLAGEYHETDRMIRVISMDTIEEIDFTKENLAYHKNTYAEYSYGTHKYEELIAKYPDQELLIKGILNPCNIDEAIRAKDGTILSYDKSFVEQNEYSLMERLQDWVYGYFKRWYQGQYNLDNRYYNLTFMGILYTKLVDVILALRLESVFTNEANSYHYRRYLASHGFLDFYLDQMSLKQILIFYKNIRWVEKNIGHHFTQQWLIKNVLTLRNLPLSEYNFIQDDANLLDDPKLRITPKFEKVSLNGLESIDPQVDTLSLTKMLDKEDKETFYNPTERGDIDNLAYDDLTRSKNSFLKTKVLESKAIDYNNSEQFILENVLLDYWIEMVRRDLYRAYVIINHPKSGESVPLTGLNALLLFTVAVFKMNKIQDECIPDYVIGLVPRKTRPSHEDIRKVIPDNTLVSNEWIEFLRKSFSPMSPVMTTIDFYEQANAQFKLINNLINLANKDEHIDARSYKNASVYQLYTTQVVSFRKPGLMNFHDFLHSIAFDTRNFDVDDWAKVADDIWKKATGLSNIKVGSLYNTHKAMIQLLTKLSSYSVQYIKEINDKPISATNMIGIRVNSEKKSKLDLRFRNNDSAVQILDDDTKGLEDVHSVNDTNAAVRVKEFVNHSIISFDIDVSVKDLDGKSQISLSRDIRTGSACFSVGDDLDGVDNPMNLPNIPGMRSWLLMDNKLKRRIVDQFDTNLVWDKTSPNTEVPKEPISWNMSSNEIDGLDYTKGDGTDREYRAKKLSVDETIDGFKGIKP